MHHKYVTHFQVKGCLTLSQMTNFRLFQMEVKEFADNFKFDETERIFSKQVENIVRKKQLLITRNFSFSHSVLKRIVLQTSKNQGRIHCGKKEFAHFQKTCKTADT